MTGDSATEKSEASPSALVNCIIPAFNVGRYLRDAVYSVLRQTIGFDRINLVIVDDGSTDETRTIIDSFCTLYPSIRHIYQENAGVSAARNAGLALCESELPAEYTCFLDGDDKYDPRHMKVLIDALKKYTPKLDETATEESRALIPNVAFLPIRWFEARTDLHFLDDVIRKKRTGLIDTESTDMIFAHVTPAVFRTTAIFGERFDESYAVSEDVEFLLKVLQKTSNAVWYNENVFYNLRKRADESSTIDNIVTKAAYYARIPAYRRVVERFMENPGHVPRLVQRAYIYDFHWLKVPEAVPSDYDLNFDIDQLLSDIAYVVQHIDDDILQQRYIPYWYRAFFMQMKHGAIRFHSVVNEIEPRFYIGDVPFETLAGDIQVRFVEQVGQELKVRGFFVKPDNTDIRLICKLGPRTIFSSTSRSFHNDIKQYLGREIFPTLDFEVCINLSEIRPGEPQDLEFYFTRGSVSAPARIIHAWESRFYGNNRFYIGDWAVIQPGNSQNSLEVGRLTKHLMASVVMQYKSQNSDQYLFERFVEYFDAYRRRRIWLFIDRPTAIDDNAEALFRYAVRRRDGIDKFMVIPDPTYYQAFEGVSANVILFGSFEHKFLLMFAEKVISSVSFHDYVYVDTNIAGWEFKEMVSALGNAQEVFLQHGVIRESSFVDRYLNSSSKNPDMVVASTRPEYRLLTGARAGFSADVVKLTGLPRFDRLTDMAERIVTFIPTWRPKWSRADHSYNPQFQHSDLCGFINDFLNDAELHSVLKEHGFTLVFKVHPMMRVQLEDFAVPEDVIVADAEPSYRELFERSSIMITDYSSSIVDFAYLRKPIIFYQPIPGKEVETPGYFSYENDDFGAIVTTMSDVVEKVSECIRDGCVMEEKYRERVDRFFAFHDKRNSERVYKAVLRLPRHLRSPEGLPASSIGRVSWMWQKLVSRAQLANLNTKSE